MRKLIRNAALSASLLSLLVVSQQAHAEDYPSRPIKIIQGYAPGGTADAVARIVGKALTDKLGQSVVVESRPGAGGNLSSEQVAHSPADGYTLALLTTAHVISPALYKSLPFDPVNDFEFIANITDAPYIFVVNADSPYKTLKQLADSARAKPGTITVGTAGVGTGQHLCSELFASSIKTKFVHVPYRGDAAAVNGLLSHSVDFIVAPGTAIRGNIKAGKFRALAISSAQRWPELPNVPTVGETVVPGFNMVGFLALGTTHGVPKAIVDKLTEAVKAALSQPDVDKRIRSLGLIPHYSTPHELKDNVGMQIARWKEVVEQAKIPKR